MASTKVRLPSGEIVYLADPRRGEAWTEEDLLILFKQAADYLEDNDLQLISEPITTGETLMTYIRIFSHQAAPVEFTLLLNVADREALEQARRKFNRARAK